MSRARCILKPIEPAQGLRGKSSLGLDCCMIKVFTLGSRSDGCESKRKATKLWLLARPCVLEAAGFAPRLNFLLACLLASLPLCLLACLLPCLRACLPACLLLLHSRCKRGFCKRVRYQGLYVCWHSVFGFGFARERNRTKADEDG